MTVFVQALPRLFLAAILTGGLVAAETGSAPATMPASGTAPASGAAGMASARATATSATATRATATSATPAATTPASVRADSLLARARTAARQDRHREAIAAFTTALTLAPERAAEIEGPLAFQYAWAGKLATAKRWFERALAARPNDYDLRMGQLLVENWMGDHLRAAAGYTQVAAAHPDRPAPRVGLAAARNWAGRRDLALRALRKARAIDPHDRDATRLEAAVRGDLRPTGGAFYDWSEDSDGYQVNSVWTEAGVSPHPQLRVVPFAHRVGIRRPHMPPIDETWLGVTAASRPWTHLGFWGRGSVLLDPAEGSRRTPYAATLRADWTATDRFGGAVSFDRFAVVSYRTFPEKITGRTWSLVVQIRPDWLSQVRVAADYAQYDPGSTSKTAWGKNHRVNFSVAASRQVWSPPRLRLGLTARYLDFHRYQDNGIWTPDDFRCVAGMAQWNWGRRDSWSVNGTVEMGAAREASADPSVYLAYRVGLFRAVGSFLLDLTAGHSEGNVETWTGYDRSYLHAGLRRRF